jgi:hypothetical protein
VTGAAAQYSVRRDSGRLPAPDGADDFDAGLVETWPRTAEGAIVAVNRAADLSVKTHDPHEVRLPDGALLCRYVEGVRADLPGARRMKL